MRKLLLLVVYPSVMVWRRLNTNIEDSVIFFVYPCYILCFYIWCSLLINFKSSNNGLQLLNFSVSISNFWFELTNSGLESMLRIYKLYFFTTSPSFDDDCFPAGLSFCSNLALVPVLDWVGMFSGFNDWSLGAEFLPEDQSAKVCDKK